MGICCAYETTAVDLYLAFFLLSLDWNSGVLWPVLPLNASFNWGIEVLSADMFLTSITVSIVPVPETNTRLTCQYQYRYLLQNQCHHHGRKVFVGRIWKSSAIFTPSCYSCKRASSQCFIIIREILLTEDWWQMKKWGKTVIIHSGSMPTVYEKQTCLRYKHFQGSNYMCLHKWNASVSVSGWLTFI